MTHRPPTSAAIVAVASRSKGSKRLPRIAGHRLQRIRAEHFRMHPLCAMCERKGWISLACELDHIIALANGGKDEASNRQGLCRDCHQEKTRADLGFKERAARIGPDGWPIEERFIPEDDEAEVF